MGDHASDAFIEVLRDPEIYPSAVASVEILQTHISWLVFVGDEVYKVKKPVRTAFLDFSSLDRRRHFCEEEVRLNRFLAPDLYIGVVPLSVDGTGRRRFGGDGEIVEWAVRMRRLPADRMMDALLSRGELDNAMLDELAGLLVRFHEQARADEDVATWGDPGAVRHVVLSNLAELAPWVGEVGEATRAVMSPPVHANIRERLLDFLERHEDLLQRRVEEGRIREGHGDLHAGNVCFEAGGIVVYDAIEFSETFRCGDVAADLAFCAMDLDFRGFRAFAHYLVRSYGLLAHDDELSQLIGFYKTHRALVRAKVAALQVGDHEFPAQARRRAALAQARSYSHLAASYGIPPALVLTCGLPGCGKSHFARDAARPFEAVVVRSDAIRKRLGGLRDTSSAKAPPGEGLYDTAMSDKTYATMLRKASQHLAAGRMVIVDAAFSTAQRRAPFRELAQRQDCRFVLAHVHVPVDVATRRLKAREADAAEVSDADARILRYARTQFEPPSELPAETVLEVDGRSPPDITTSALLTHLTR